MTDELNTFMDSRRLLFSVAYRLLGAVADAEDAVQDAWIAWTAADRSDVRDPRAYLVRTVTNLCLNRLTSASARREQYVGPWLPEPVLTERALTDRVPTDRVLTEPLPAEADVAEKVAESVDLAQSLSMALLVVLESLSPLERAVFVLHEVFGYQLTELAQMLDRREAAVRQLAHRAREHVRARRPRFDVDPDERRRVVSGFQAACEGGDLSAMMALLAPDVILWTDGGGKVTAAIRPIRGADRVARWLMGVLAKPETRAATLELAGVNGEDGLLIRIDGRPIGAWLFDVEDEHIATLRLQANPDKLRGLRG